MKTLLIAALALAPQEKKPVVACTLPILECLVREVGGEDVEVFSLCKADQDPHYVRATPLLQRKLRGADYFIEVGLQLEVWADLVANDSGRPRLQKGGAGRVVASTGIPREQIPTELSRAEGHVHAEGNPHLWLDPLRAVRMAKNIAAALPLKKEAVDKRLKAFEARVREALFGKELLELAGAEELERRTSDGTLFAWLEKEELDGKKLSARLGGWLKKAEGLRGKKAVEYHRSWIYTAKILGFEIVGGVEEKPGIPPGPRHQIELTKKLKEGGIAFILVDDFYDPALPKTLSADSGVPVLILPNQPASGGYVEFFDGLVDRLVKR
ncbi:MAG TPA: metal ABC transporter substrate-binding protein [Planctomycetota bacterium]